MLKLITATITFLILDGIWLGVLAKQMYIDKMGHLLRLSNGSIQARWPAAVVVYIALIGGILYFVIPKAQGNPLMALLIGAIFGFVTYATYDFTNLAVINNWPVYVTIIDVIWGMVICGITSGLTVWICR